MALGWLHDPRFLQHETGPAHVERPERLEVIVDALDKLGWLGRMESITFRAANAEQLALVHDPAYVDLVRIACEEGFTFISSQDTCICPRSYKVATPLDVLSTFRKEDQHADG